VKLDFKSGYEAYINGFIGELQSVDGYMNIALEQTREFVDGKQRRTYGDAFVRGNNGRRIWYHVARSRC
jgi:small nuclear ribonucleoprotein (snRNP)-like protein